MAPLANVLVSDERRGGNRAGAAKNIRIDKRNRNGAERLAQRDPAGAARLNHALNHKGEELHDQ